MPSHIFPSCTLPLCSHFFLGSIMSNLLFLVLKDSSQNSSCHLHDPRGHWVLNHFPPTGVGDVNLSANCVLRRSNTTDGNISTWTSALRTVQLCINSNYSTIDNKQFIVEVLITNAGSYERTKFHHLAWV